MGTLGQEAPSFFCFSLAHGAPPLLPQRWLLRMKSVANVPSGLGRIYFLGGINLYPQKEHPKLPLRVLR